MKLRIIVVGRDKNDPIVMASSTYLERLERYYPVELIEVKEEPARATTPIVRVRALEAERIRKALGAADHLIALDERGKELSSVELASRLGRLANEGKQAVSFVIGGPNGLDASFIGARDRGGEWGSPRKATETVPAEARELWSLSRLTLPHRLARLVLLEQLYRACTILRKEPYHK